MKKLLTFLLIITALASSAQVYQRDPAFGRSIDRYEALKALHIPMFCGTPNLTGDVLLHTSAIAADTCNNKLYLYNPKDSSWNIISGSGGKNILAGYLLTYSPNDSTLAVDTSALFLLTLRIKDSGIAYLTPSVKKYDSTALNYDSSKYLHFNIGHLVDSVDIPITEISIVQDGAGETHIVRVEDSTHLHFPTIKNSDDITASKNTDSSVIFNFTNPHYTKDQVDSIAATLTASGITRAELIDTADNKVNISDTAAMLAAYLQKNTVSGGTINQVLKKNSSTDYDWSWQDESGGGKDSSAIHVGYITIPGDTSIVFSDLKGNSDTVNITLLQLWKRNGSKIYYNSGNVGIGVDTPSAKLSIRANMAETTNLADSVGIVLSNADSSNNTIKPSLPIVMSSYGYLSTGNRHYKSNIRLRSEAPTGSSLFKPNLYIEGSTDGGLTYSLMFTLTTNSGIIVPGPSTFAGISGSFANFTSSVTASGLISTTTTTSPIVNATTRLDVGNPSVDYSAVHNDSSSTQGYLPPRMTTVQRDSINLVVTGVTITNGGSYTGTPTVGFSSTNKYVVATGTVVKTGSAVTSVTITNGGNYYKTPNISFSGGSGSGATATAVVTQTLTPGLTIYCTDCTATDSSTGVMQTWNGTTWKNHW